MLRLTRQVEIAIDILMLCARSQTNAHITTRLAAEFTGATKDHATQVVAKLSRHRYLGCTRGRTGGIRRAHLAACINVSEALRPRELSLGAERKHHSAQATTALRTMMDLATETLVATFDDFTIAGLVADPTASRIDCLDCGLLAVVRHSRAFSCIRGRLSHDHDYEPLPAGSARTAASRAA